MRRAGPAIAAALLAACTVEVDGAPCTAPGTTSECPGGQACGNNLRCSARALACAGSRCTPDVGGDCLADPVGLATGTSHARRCTEEDPVCGTWVVEPCADRGLACGARSGGARCECPPREGGPLAARPDGTRAGALPFPTGAPTPPGCAFRTVGDALARAAELRALTPSAPVTVLASGAAAGGKVTFSAAAGEVFPLTIGGGLSVESDDPGSAESYELLFDGEADATAVVVLRGGALRGFTIRNGDRARAGAGIEIACEPGVDPATVSSVIVEARSAGGAQLAHGVRGARACSASLDRVHVRDAAASGILWDPGATSAWVHVDRSSVTGSGAGIEVRTGTLYARDDRIADNVGPGLTATWPGGAPVLRVESTRIVRNGGTGVVLTAAAGIWLGHSTVFANRASAPWGGAAVPSGLERRGGGVVLGGAPASFWMPANRVYANEGDQIVVLGSGPGGHAWSFDEQEACVLPQGASLRPELVANVIGCFDPSPAGTTQTSSGEVHDFPYRGIVGLDASFTASHQWWFGAGPRGLLRLPEGLEDAPQCSTPWVAPIASCSSEEPPAELPYLY